MQTLMIPTLLEPDAEDAAITGRGSALGHAILAGRAPATEGDPTIAAWLEAPRGPAPPDLGRIFADIADTAITRAAGIPCSLAEYRDGLELIARRLAATIASVPVFPPGVRGPRGSVVGRPLP